MTDRVKVKAMAAMKPGIKMEPWEYETKPLGAEDVHFDIKMCGLCHSDLSQSTNEWKMLTEDRFPIVPGHEAVGIVTAVGSAVKDLKAGDRVGLGAQCYSCQECETCKNNQRPLCKKCGFTYACDVTDETGTWRHYGGYATGVTTDARFVVKIPDAIELKYAGPLLCAGITVYNPLVTHGTKDRDVGILGIGGLGHLGLQFAAHLGASSVVALSHNDNKKDLSTKMGATKYVNTSNADEMKAADSSLDLIISTVSASIDFNAILALLRPGGTFVTVGLPADGLNISGFALFTGKKVTGSGIGDPTMIKDMLDVCAEHDIKPLIEVFPMTKVNDAITKVLDCSIRFRAVLENDL